MSRQSRAGVAILALVFAGGCGDAVAPGEAGSPSMSNKPPQGPQQPTPQPPVIAFLRIGEIHRMYANGTNITRLTFSAAADSQPAWSPAGQKLAWVRGTAGATQVYVMKADGSGKANLSNSTTRDRQPVWSPDGTKILFERRLAGFWLANWEVYVMNADGSGQVNVSNHLAYDGDARWSPSGDQIVFVSMRDGNREVYRINTDGTGAVNLTQNPDQDKWPDWSPDGQRIAFVREGSQSVPVRKLYTMNADGSAQAELNPALKDVSHPRWSPSGSALLALTNGADKLCVLDADGSDPYCLTAELFSASWSADGSRIAMARYDGSDGSIGIWTVGPDGSNLTKVTNTGSQDYNDESPVWRP